MVASTTLSEIKSWPVEDRLELVYAVWDSIAIDAGVSPLSPDVRQLLDERIAHANSHPEDVMTWEAMKAELHAERLRA